MLTDDREYLDFRENKWDRMPRESTKAYEAFRRYRDIPPDERRRGFAGPGGESRPLAGAVQDITEYHRLEERFRRAQKLEAVGRLAGGVAHDFNNLLVAINGYSDMILSELRSDDPLHGPAEEILKAGQRASALTRQLLTFSGRRPVRPKVMELNALVADMEKMLRRLLMENISFRLELDPDLLPLSADVNQMEQVIMNLVVNAGDAMRAGGVLSIATSTLNSRKTRLRGLRR